jgi:cell division protein FtsZ
MIVTVIATGYELKAKESTIDDFATQIFKKTTNEQVKMTPTGFEKQTERVEKEEPKASKLPSWLQSKK